jgi:hypothetical protein
MLGNTRLSTTSFIVNERNCTPKRAEVYVLEIHAGLLAASELASDVNRNMTLRYNIASLCKGCANNYAHGWYCSSCYMEKEAGRGLPSFCHTCHRKSAGIHQCPAHYAHNPRPCKFCNAADHTAQTCTALKNSTGGTQWLPLHKSSYAQKANAHPREQQSLQQQPQQQRQPQQAQDASPQTALVPANTDSGRNTTTVDTPVATVQATGETPPPISYASAAAATTRATEARPSGEIITVLPPHQLELQRRKSRSRSRSPPQPLQSIHLTGAPPSTVYTPSSRVSPPKVTPPGAGSEPSPTSTFNEQQAIKAAVERTIQAATEEFKVAMCAQLARQRSEFQDFMRELLRQGAPSQDEEIPVPSANAGPSALPDAVGPPAVAVAGTPEASKKGPGAGGHSSTESGRQQNMGRDGSDSNAGRVPATGHNLGEGTNAVRKLRGKGHAMANELSDTPTARLRSASKKSPAGATPDVPQEHKESTLRDSDTEEEEDALTSSPSLTFTPTQVGSVE